MPGWAQGLGQAAKFVVGLLPPLPWRRKKRAEQAAEQPAPTDPVAEALARSRERRGKKPGGK